MAKATNKRPQPPDGFESFKWSRGKDKYGNMRDACPNCGGFGSSWGGKDGGGWTDPRAQKAYDDGIASGINLRGAGDPTISCDGIAILCHWSRYGLGRCTQCGCSFWHDFGGGDIQSGKWHYFYKPTQGQLSLFGVTKPLIKQSAQEANL